ncbi:MAG: carbohydrate porin [Planctomycetota bacterium]
MDHGVYLDVAVTQVFQGNAYGGRTMNSGFKYGGSASYYISLDSGKLDLWPGGLIMLHGETVFGESGVEVYYNFEVTPAFQLTGDVQFIFNPSAGNPSSFNDDNLGIAVGVRAQLSF